MPNTEYRADGNFWIKRVCESCGEDYHVHALANAIGDNGRCGSCEESIWYLEYLYGKHLGDSKGKGSDTSHES